ncbi:hypothetical protein ACMX2H_18795, partial [Arthrobacter sulfonylureivorans]
MTETGGRGDRPEATGAGTGATSAPGPAEDGVSKQHDTAAKAARPDDAGAVSSADAAPEPTPPLTAEAEPGQPAAVESTQPATDEAEQAQLAAASEPAPAQPAAAKPESAAQPAAAEAESVQPATAVQPIDRKAARRAARRDRTRDAAAGKMQARSGGTAAPGPGRGSGRRTFGAVAGAGILLLTGAAVAAGSLADAPGAATELPPVSAAVPAGDYTAVCPEPLRLLDSAADATDPQFSPVSTTAQTRARALVLSDLSGKVPGSELTELGEDTPLKRIAEPTAESSGETKVVASVVSGQELSAPTVLRADPVGETTALAGAAMTYRASDG